MDRALGRAAAHHRPTLSAHGAGNAHGPGAILPGPGAESRENRGPHAETAGGGEEDLQEARLPGGAPLAGVRQGYEGRKAGYDHDELRRGGDVRGARAVLHDERLAAKQVAHFSARPLAAGEKKQKLTVNDGNDVRDIKRTVGNIFALDPNDFHLSSGGVTMDESTPFNDYSVGNGDDVLLIPASTAG